MAERRMFSKTIIDSDAFLEIPLSSQVLYFHLSVRADDDGFINNPKKIQRMVGCAEDDVKVLVAKAFIIPFESGVVAIRHWKIHNYIQKDRYRETMYKYEKPLLTLEANNSYSLINSTVTYKESNLNTVCIPSGYNMDTQVSIDKFSTDKASLGKDKLDEQDKPVRNKYGMYNNVILSKEDLDKLKDEFKNDYNERIERLSEYIASTGKVYNSHLATIRMWSRKEDKDMSNRQDNLEVDNGKVTWRNFPNASESDKAYMTAEEYKQRIDRISALPEDKTGGIF